MDKVQRHKIVEALIKDIEHVPGGEFFLHELSKEEYQGPKKTLEVYC